MRRKIHERNDLKRYDSNPVATKMVKRKKTAAFNSDYKEKVQREVIMLSRIKYENIVKKFAVKPYYLEREKQKALGNRKRTASRVREARAAAQKAQHLLENVANRKRTKQLETHGFVIIKEAYGSGSSEEER